MRLDLNPDRLIPELARYQRQLLIAGGAGAAVSLVGLFLDRRQFFQSYLMTFMLLLGATLGSLALGMIHQLSGGAWGVVTRRIFGAASRVLPVLTAPVPAAACSASMISTSGPTTMSSRPTRSCRARRAT